MLDTGSPPLEREEKDLAVSPPLSSHNVASRCSTPGLSSLDGTPRYLYVSQEAPLSLTPPSQEMAIRPAIPLSHGLHAGQNEMNRSEMPSHTAESPKTKTPNGRRPLDVPVTSKTKPDEERRPVAPLSHISHLLRSQKYNRHRCSQAEENLQCLQIATAKTARLVHASRTIQRTLAECIKGEDKDSFANLLHAFHDACDDCSKPPLPARSGTEIGLSASHGAPSCFLQDLSSSSRTAILEFLARIRCNDDFVADRLASLTHKELLALLPDRSVARSTDSILGGQSRVNSRSAKPLGFVVDTQIELLSSYSYGSPLEALVHAVRSISGADRTEGRRMTDLWASVCAKLISERKDGTDRLVPAVLDIWTSTQPWPGKDRLEVWILQTLQNGSFLLEQPSKTKQSFRARVEGRSDLTAEDELRAEAFYTESADSLLDLLGDDHGPTVLPPGALEMCHAMWNSLDSSIGHQRALPRFLITRWLFSTFVLDAITLPETHGLLTDHYVSDLSRQRILREVANRVQKAAFEVAYSWTHGSTLSADTTHRVYKVMARLQGSPFPSPECATQNGTQRPGDTTETFLVISAKDLNQCLSALYPQRRPASIASDGDNLKSGLQSSASSVSGFSLFSNARSLEPLSDTSLPDMRNCRLTESTVTSDNLDTEDQSSMSCREAYLELQELISGHANDARDVWEVLYSSSVDSSLITLREKTAQIASAANGSSRKSKREDAAHSLSKELLSCRSAVEMLLLDDNAEFSTESDLRHSRGELDPQRIESLFELSIQDCEARTDFVKAHSWFRQLRDFRYHVVDSEDKNALQKILEDLETNALRSIERSASLTAVRDEWLSRLKSTSQLRAIYLDPLLKEQRLMRDKMWYVADVRVSGPYDEARSIAAALRVMGKPKRLSRTRVAPPLRHWNVPKTSSNNLHLKTEAQVLDILSARPDHGGPNKLSDEQSKLVELWMDRQNVDNLCRGEERLHKLCMEVRKCVDLITATTPADHPAIHNNILFARDENLAHDRASQRRPTFPTVPHGANGAHSYLSLTSQARSNEALSTTSRALSSVSSQDYLESRSPTLTNQSSVPFWSPSNTEVDSRSSATSIGTSRTQSVMNIAVHKPTNVSAAAKNSSIDAFRQRTTSLLLSDLTSILFSDGSETDHAYWSGLGRDLTERYFRSLRAFQTSVGSQTPRTDFSVPLPASIPGFDFESAFATLLAKFSVIANPATKLACLYDIDRLLAPYIAEKAEMETPVVSFRRGSESGDLTPSRRAKDPTETSISGFRDIFSKSSLRPTTIFRDLQYIAALLPSAVLQETPAGKAFCNAAVAISSLKQEARTIMVETADSIIAYHSNNRGHGRTSSTAQQERDSAIFSAPSRTPSAEDVSRYSMADAGYLLQITAREGDTVAQRELATLYLTHPELMERIVAPFARPRDVFKDELESKWRKNQDPNRCDPTTMCVAHHWMSLSSKGGDSLAKEYLRQREEMDSF